MKTKADLIQLIIAAIKKNPAIAAAIPDINKTIIAGLIADDLIEKAVSAEGLLGDQEDGLQALPFYWTKWQ